METRFFGQYLLAQGLITADQLLAAVAYQNRSNPRFGELAIARGAVTAEQVGQIHALQGHEDLFFGEAAIKLGLLTAANVEDLLATQQDRHVHLGQALLALGHLAEEDLQHALAAFQATEALREPGLALPQAWPGTPLATQLLRLTPRVLTRTWGLPSKPDTPRICQDGALLSDLNMAVALAASPRAELLLGVPYAAAHKATVSVTPDAPQAVAPAPAASAGSQPQAPDERPSEAQLQQTVRKLADALAHHLISTSAERGQRIAREPARLCPQEVNLSEPERAVLVPFLTHVGKVVVGLVV